MLKNWVFLLVFLFGLSACSEYQRVLKSPNPELKYEKAIEYYKEGEYQKAQPLFEELIPLYRGTDKGQEIFFFYAYTSFYEGYLVSAAYHFRKYSSTYPNSQRAEEALFMSAYCNYLDSPVPTLDQTPTKLALEELQIFVNTYPKSDLVDSANVLVDELNLKLETKAFLNARQYYKIRKYKAAITALENLLTEYPGGRYAEEIKYLIVLSYYELAINSIDEKKLERFDEGIAAYIDFIDNFADGSFSNEAQITYAKLVREREKFLTENSN